MFTEGPVRFLSLDGISFARPVAIGSILRLTSQILYTTSSEQFPNIAVCLLFSEPKQPHLLFA